MATIACAVVIATLGFLCFTMVRSIRDHDDGRSGVWRQFGLGLGLMILFVASWLAHLVFEWQTFTDEQRALGQSTSIGDFVTEFGKSTMENWQSEFLQLFSFVVLAALYVHKGSAESKDGTDRMEASLRRIEERLGTVRSDGEPAVGPRDGAPLPDASI
jgi:hypothetical protein